MFCPRCARPREGELRFCRSCSFDFEDTNAPQRDELPIAKDWGNAGVPGAVDCPNRGHPQFIQKVSAIYAAGSSTSVIDPAAGELLASQHFNMRTTTSTGLASALQPPPSPGMKEPWGCGSAVWYGFWGFGLFLTLGHMDGRGISYDPIAGLVWSGVFIGLPFIMQIWESSNRSKEVATKTELWHGLKATWDDSYYCHKCGIVFRSGSPSWETPEAFRVTMEAAKTAFPQ